MGEYLNRDDAPFGDEVWDTIDKTVVSVASNAMAGRKLLNVEGPYGLGMKSVSLRDELIEGDEDELSVWSSRSIPLAMISSSFKIDGRDLGHYTRDGVLFDMREVVSSTLECARKEDELIFKGSEALGVKGLMNTPGALSSELKPWRNIGDPAESIALAVEKLDKAGFQGPYSMALAPSLYNRLFRRYPGEEVLEIEHLSALVSDGIFKSSVLSEGGVLVASGAMYGSVVLGQDLLTAFEGPSGRSYVFVLSESVALRVNVPQAICALKPAG
ncbi:Bacteriocin [Chitinispirillum alkaliphilum]|nr:Bacteriocin [Chitinispirillum alkaliphilum]